MISFFWGGAAGIVLAILTFFASAFFTSAKIISTFKSLSVAIVLIGFMVRLALVGLVFYGLSMIKAVHFQTALLSFAAAFTFCLLIKAVQAYRKLGRLKPEPTKS